MSRKLKIFLSSLKINYSVNTQFESWNKFPLNIDHLQKVDGLYKINIVCEIHTFFAKIQLHIM